MLTKEDNWPALLATFLGHEKAVKGVAISSDGKTVVSASDDRTIRCVVLHINDSRSWCIL